MVDFVHSLGGQVFFDGKFDDIPNTVGGAARAVSAMGVKMFNVHATAGIEAMEAAMANKGDSLVLAVTILTSLGRSDASLVFGGSESTESRVLSLARCAQLAGIDGIICSPKELDYIRHGDPEFEDCPFVTPGIRPEWAATDDQKRITTPAEAIAAGATYLVIGRPITKPPAEVGTPVAAVRLITAEITAWS